MRYTSDSRSEQEELLHRPASRQIINRVADDTSTFQAALSNRFSMSGPPTIVTYDDSLIDEKVFEWDNEIANAQAYRVAINNAKLSPNIASKSVERDGYFDNRSLGGTEESSDQPSQDASPVSTHRQKPLPYDMSLVSEPLYGRPDRVTVPKSSISDGPSTRKSILSYRQKPQEADKRSLWSTISGKRSSRNLAPSERSTTSGSVASRITSPGFRRGRRGFEASHHTSIDFGSEDGLSAPPIVRAAQAGSVVEVEKLLDQRADINARHVPSGRNALSVASHCGNDEVVRLLLQNGAVDERDASGLTALHLASLRGHVEVVESLLQEHTDVDVKGPKDQTPLRIASEKGQLEVAELLLRKRAKANARDSSQMTPLHVAAKKGDEAMAELLINHGAHVEAKDSNFMGALHHACEGGHSGVVAALLNKKANMDAPGKASMTPLMCACSAGKVQVAEVLLKKKASPKLKGEGEMTALHWASFNGHVEAVDLLLQKKAPITATNKDGRTSLHLAVMAEEFAVADLLLRKGASVESPCKSMLKPVHYAFTSASLEIAQLLLGYNASIEAEDRHHNRPLHNACTRGSLPHVELLIQKGVSIDARNASGDRPLCLASSLGHVNIVRALLDRGAAIRSKFSTGPSHEDSPLCLAAKNGHVQVVQELLARGASVLQKDEQNWQPLRYAAFNAHPEVVELLLRYGATVSGSASGGWGFNMTAQRIGFANEVLIEEQRKGQVMRLLTSAEAKEQKQQERNALTTLPAIPPAVQDQTFPMELPDQSTVRSPKPSAGMPPLPPRPTPEMSAEPPQRSDGNTPKPAPYSYFPAPSAANPAGGQNSPPVQNQPIANTVNAQYFQSNNIPSNPMQAFSVPMPSDQAYSAAGYQVQSPNPIPTTAAQLQNQTTYNFVPKPVSSMTSAHPVQQVIQYQPIPSAYGLPPSAQGAPTMTLGPDGLWRQVTTPLGPSPSGLTPPAPQQSINPPPPQPMYLPPPPPVNRPPAAPMNYPSGVYEMPS